ncbi:MAG TPA: hypothetical protein VK988_02010 [Acidimicrobiales bacterium]|nr:hypothetical protein [Acidimicrobiales bacterium]
MDLLASLAAHRSRLVATAVVGILAQTSTVGVACTAAWLVSRAVTGSAFGAPMRRGVSGRTQPLVVLAAPAFGYRRGRIARTPELEAER